MEEKNIIKKLSWTLDISPDMYERGIYIVYSEEYGFWSKKEAQIICEFLRQGKVIKMVRNIFEK